MKEIVEGIMLFLENEFLGNPLINYAICIFVLFVGILFLEIIRRIFIRNIKKNENASFKGFLLTILQKIVFPVFYIVVFFISVQNINFHEKVDFAIKILLLFFVVHFVIKLIISFFEYLLMNYWVIKKHDESKARSLGGLLGAIKIILWFVGLTFILDNLGFKISTIVAGLGIGGIAVALAAQKVLGDLFSYFAILFDKPFEIGDFVVVGEERGTIEYIGIKTTRIRSISGEQIIFSNVDLTNARVRNFKRMQRRRALFTIGVTYETPLEKLEKIPEIIKGIIDNTENADFDRAHFFKYENFSLNYEIVYYIDNSDYTAFMDIQQKINLELKKRFLEEKIDFAYPTQLIYHKNI